MDIKGEIMITEIQIMVAVDQCGNVECIPYVPYNSQEMQKAKEFRQKKLEDKKPWAISYLRAHVPVPTEPMIEAKATEKPDC